MKMETEEIRWIHRDNSFREMFSLNVSFQYRIETKEMFLARMDIMWETMQQAIRSITKLEKVQ